MALWPLTSQTVIIDMRWETFERDAPDPLDPSFAANVNESLAIYPITCIGKAAEGRAKEVLAERELYFELDMTNWRVIRCEDRSSL